MKKTTNKLLALLLAMIMALSCVTPAFAADANTVDEVAAEIEALSADAHDYTAADREMVEGIKADYDALSAEDQAILDERCTHTGTGQPLGRVLESALWTVWSFDEADNSTTLPDGVYNATSEPALSSEYSKGKSTSSRQKPWSVKEVEVRDGKAYATITVESSSYSGIMIYGTEYAKTNTSGNSEFANVPIDLNSTFYFNGVSTSMPIPIAFSLTTTIEESTVSEPEHIDLTITNNTGMFKAVTAYLEIEDGQTTLVFALSGTGYHELFKGTYEQAAANGDGTADNGNDSWIHGAVNADGKWEFRIPVAEDETYIPVVAISNSYYEKYLNGQNSLERAFYPRQMELDREAATLVTGDYEFSRELTVTNNVSMFKVSGAALDTVGGPNSNNYKSTLELTMGSTSFDKAYVGRMSEIGEDTAVIDVTEEQVFSLPVKWVANFGQPETLVNLLDEPFIVSFHSVKNDSWYERQFTVSEAEGTLVIDKVYADYTAVDAALARVPADLSIYTDESVAALQSAIDAVVRDLTSDKQAQVDAMAQAIEDAIDALVERVQRTDLTITNNTGMFKAVTAYLEIEDGQTTLVMALSGTGYHELFKGTYEQAVANGDNTDNWIHGAVNDAGKWEFRIPVAEDESYIPVVAISNSYYEKYLNGQNSLERAFYPRQMELDREAATLVTGDYEFSRELTVTNNVTMFKVSGAALDTVGGPNSNNYKSTLELTMGSTSFDKAYVGRMSEIGEDTAVIDVTEEQVFSLPVKWVANFGQPETLVNLLDEPFIVSFHSVKNDSWYERQFTVSEAEGTLVIDKVYADYTAVDAALARVPADLSIYTDESVAALQSAIDAVVRDLTSDKQAQVDAMAQAIEDAIDALVEIAPVVITAQPESFTGSVGETAVFTVAAEGADLTYQWQYKAAGGSVWRNSGMTGADTPSLHVPVTASRHGQQYRCVVTDRLGNEAVSEAAQLQVTFDPVAIVSQPEDFVGAEGETAVFAVEATGHGLTYQWQYKAPGGGTWRNSSMTGAKTAALRVVATAARSGQMYRCIVTDDAGNQVISDEVWLVVGSGPVIMAQPQSANCELNTAAVFTVDAAGSGLTYQWQYYTGSKWLNSGLTGNKTASLSVKATAARNGQQYRCVITDADGKTVTTLVVKLTVKLTVTAQPQNVTANAGEMATFTVAATGADLTYRWQYYTGSKWVNSSMTGNRTASLSVKATAARNGQQYRCIITDANGNTVTTEAAVLTVR